ncbi:hypothetical protein ZONE111904_00420 [Zobellia nedashkovskayae]
MKNLREFEISELSLDEMKSIEGGSINFDPIHIYIPREPVIIRRNPLRFNKLILWS